MESRLLIVHIGHFVYAENSQMEEIHLCLQLDKLFAVELFLTVNGGDTFVFEVGQAVCSRTVSDCKVSELTKSVQAFLER
jgi:hypothetical protein